MSRPGARPTLNTPKRRKHKVNQQNKTKKRKKFRSFSSSLAEPTTVCNRRTVGRSQGPEGSQPASSLHVALLLLLLLPSPPLVSPAGRAPLPLPLPAPMHGAVPLQLRRRAEGRQGPLWPPGAAGTREGEEGHCSVVEVDVTGSSLLLGYLQGRTSKQSEPNVKGGDISKNQVPAGLWEAGNKAPHLLRRRLWSPVCQAAEDVPL